MTGNVLVVQVSFYLAKLNDSRPWTDFALNAGPAQIALGPWSTAAVLMRAMQPPVGEWELSAWVHYKQNASSIHSDELFLTQLITVR